MFKRDNLYLAQQKLASYLGNIESHVITDSLNQYCYLESGRDNQPCIIFLHGILGTKAQWRGLMESLSTTHRVLSIDLPGLSQSSQCSLVGYDFNSLVIYLNAFLTKLRIETCSIVGHCVGGNLGQQYQSQFPLKVSSLLLVSPVGMELQNSTVLVSKVSRFRHMLDFDSYDEFNSLVNNLFYQPIKVAKILLEIRMKELIRNKTKMLAVVRDIEKSLPDTIDSMANCSCPKLIICGDSDIFIDREELDCIQGYKNTELNVITECGHVPFLEYPKKTDQLVRIFLLKYSH